MTTTAATLAAFSSTRKFGIEIEAKGLTRDQAAEVLSAAGIEARNDGYSHAVTQHWKVVEDGSVDGGFEVVSPILSGSAGLQAVLTAAKALVAAGAFIDLQCGLHVHVDANDLTGADVLNAVNRYRANEAAIDAVIPASRRNTRWARSMAEVVSRLSHMTPNATARAVCEQISYSVGRYFKLNLDSFLRHGTLEFRQHSGTVDGVKMVNWVMFCVTFIDDSKLAPVAPVVAAAPVVVAPVRQRSNAIAVKFAKLLELFSRTGYYSLLSVATIAQELEISATSVPSYVSQFRDRYPTVTVSMRRGRGYYCQNPTVAQALVRGVAPAPVAASPAPVRAPQRGVFDNLPAEVRSYFAERAVDFAA